MRLLLDTCTILWQLESRQIARLSAKAQRAIRDPDNDVYLSVVSQWEIAVKYARGSLRMAHPPSHYFPAAREKLGLRLLPLDEASVILAERLPEIHRDPFDRMLVCQALAHALTIVTPDPQIGQYPVAILW
jgi:PIN domain nuclease of toxin-antitoxin system